jgi:hypothetical protein
VYIANKKQSGFSAIISIVSIVLVIGVSGFIGWRLLSQPAQPNKQAASETTSNNANSPISPASTNSTTATTQPTYLDIKELGIKITLDDSIKDAIYTVHTDTDGSQFAYISTTSLTSASKGTCSPDKGGFASITKSTGTTQQVFSPAVRPIDNTKTFKFGTNTYVFITGTQATCTSDSTAQNLANKQQTTFINDFKTVQPSTAPAN